MSFHDIRFPANLSFGSVGGPERRTEIVTLASGFEERNSPWRHSRRRYDAGVGLRSLADVASVIAFFEAREGRLHAFRWKDWADFSSAEPRAEITPLDQQIGLGDGETRAFTLIKSYVSGPHTYRREVTKPVSGTVVVAIENVEMQEGVDFEVDLLAGRVSFATAPAAQARITAGFEFDVPVRFDTDSLQVSVSTFHAGDALSVPVVEVRA